jgi:hypothetical protein
VVVKRVTSSDGSKQYNWEVEFVDADATGARKLGYRSSGLTKGDGSVLQFEREPAVHDENIDRWTKMNLTDRPDVRNRMTRLVTYAIRSLNKSGEEKLENIVPL